MIDIQANKSSANVSVSFCHFPRGKVIVKIFGFVKYTLYYCQI